MRWRSLREVRPRDKEAAELRALVAHRRGTVEDQARLIARLRAMLLEVFPGLEAALDLRKDRALLAVTRGHGTQTGIPYDKPYDVDLVRAGLEPTANRLGRRHAFCPRRQLLRH